MFKPKTSKVREINRISFDENCLLKKGNSEVYVICLDFHREKYLDSSSQSHSLDSNFLAQLVQCAEFFQSCQIHAIEHNLHYFHNLHRRFLKKLHQIKDQTLNAFLDQCQVRELLFDDRHLLKSLERIHPCNQRITRIGTFNNQHQIDKDFIEKKIRQGFFCLLCSKIDEEEDLCSICQIFSEMINDQLRSIPRIYVGQLIATQRTRIDCVVGQQSNNVRNSCFCNRYLLELCHQVDICQVIKENFMDFNWIKDSSSMEMSEKDLQELQQFTSRYQIDVRSRERKMKSISAPVV